MASEIVMLEYVPEIEHDAIHGRRLDELPGEIIGIIAELLTTKDLRMLRKLSNRHVAQHIDHVFGEAHFGYHLSTVTYHDTEDLKKLSISRFAKYMHTLEICPHLHCGFPQAALTDLWSIGFSCISKTIDVDDFLYVIDSVLARVPNLRRLIIRAPSPPYGTYDAVLAVEFPNARINLLHNIQSLRQSRGILAHGHVIDARPIYHLVSELARRVPLVVPNLQEFRILDFADTDWQSLLVPAKLVLSEMSCTPTLHNLTTIQLELELFTGSPDNCLASLVEITKRSTSLKVLKLRTGPRSISRYRTPSEYWAPLLEQLGGEQPPFKLHTLEIDGLTTSKTAPTLDRIVAVHSPSLRRLVLSHTNFHHPNTLHAFFSVMGKSDLHYVELKRLFVHLRATLVSGQLSYELVPEEILRPRFEHRACKYQASDYGWVKIHWDINRYNTVVVCDDEDDFYGNGWMKRWCQNAITAIECGAIEDY